MQRLCAAPALRHSRAPAARAARAPAAARPQAPLQLSASRVQIRAFSATSAVFSAAAASPLNLSLRPQPISALSSRTNSPLFPRLHLSVSTRSTLRRYLLVAGSQQQRSIPSAAFHPTRLEGLAGREHARDSKREEAPHLSPKAVELGTRLIASVALLLIGAAIWIITTDEETLAEELTRPAFATPVLAEEQEDSIYVTDAGTEGDDPSEIIQVNKKEKSNLTTLQWILKKLHKFIMQGMRAFVLAMYFAPVILTLPIYKYVPSFHDRWWDLLVKAIENSGAAFVKFGQWAASRSDLFSPEVCDRLGKLRNRAPMHAFAITKKLFQDEFGEPLEEIFAEFPDEPIASGSIAQVYKAKLKDSGETVAVKVRHPWVVDQIQFDLLLIYWLTKQITRLPSFNWMELPVSVRDFAHHLSQQVDLTLEASNLLRFIQNFAGISNVHFPRPIEPYISQSIIVESFEEGVPITHYASTPSPINSRLARMGFTAFLKMLLVDNFVHADCHSDNILVRLDKKNRPEIVMLDVGIVTQLMPYDKECIVALMKILYDRDPNRAADTMVRLSKKQKVDAVVSVPEFRADLHRVFSHIFSLPEAEAGVSRTMTSVFSVMRNHHIKMESNLALLAVSMAVLEGLARKLDPNIDLLPVAFPYLFGNFPFGRALAQLSEGMVFDRR